jgi:phage shock protein A
VEIVAPLTAAAVALPFGHREAVGTLLVAALASVVVWHSRRKAAIHKAREDAFVELIAEAEEQKTTVENERDSLREFKRNVEGGELRLARAKQQLGDFVDQARQIELVWRVTELLPI